MKRLIWLLLTALAAAPAAAAVDCPTVVQTALDATDALCETTGRNQACYGHIHLDAEPQPGVEDFVFDEVGDRVAVTALQSLRLSPMDPETGAWGVALMRLQASLPSSQPDDITLLMFGDVQIENAVQTPRVVLDVTVSADEYINVRRLPSTRASVMGVLAPGQTVHAIERLEDGSWLRVEIPDSGVIGWLDASLVTSEDDIMTLGVTESWMPRYRPMQAFYFQSGGSDPSCPEAPTSGLLIQTPEGVGQVTLLINEVSVRIGSTAFFEAQPGKELRVSTVEGVVEVEAMGETQMAVAGAEVSVPLDEENEPAAPPSKPRPYNQAEWQTLPIQPLGDEISEIPQPLTEEQIEQLVANGQARNPTPTVGSTEELAPVASVTAAPASGGVSVESVCVGEWVVRNSTAFDVAFLWDAVGSNGSGGVAPAGGTASFRAVADTVRIIYDLGSGPQSSAASSNGRACSGGALPSATTETPIEATSESTPPTQPSPNEQPNATAPPVETLFTFTEEPTVPPTVAPTNPPTQEPPTLEPPTVEPPTQEPPTPEPTATP